MKEATAAQDWPYRIVPTVIDLAMFLGMVFFVPWMAPRLFAPSVANHVLLAPGFFLILAGILAIRSLPSYALDDHKGPTLLAACLVFFQIVTFCLCYAYGTNIGGSESNNDGVAILLFFAFLLPVIGALAWPTKRAVAGTPKALAAESIGLISVNYLTLIGAAIWARFQSLPAGEDPVYATGISFLVLFAVFYGLFLAFFGLPRIYLLRATGDRLGLGLYLLGVAVFLWNKLPPVN